MSARLARTQALGPAIGTTGAGLSGPGVVIATVAPGKWLGTVSARLRTRVLSASVSLGSVLVQVALIDARSVASASDLADSIDDVAAVWAGARYVSTGRGATWHPNVYSSEEMAVVARVWNRDNLDATRRIAVDLAAVVSGEPVPGAESGHELGDFAAGSGTQRVVTGADPAAGAESSIAQPSGVVWRPVQGQIILTADATAVSRIPNFDWSRGGVSLFRIPAYPIITASQGARIQWGVGNGYTGDMNSSAATNPMREGPLGDLRSLGGDVYATVTGSLQAGDNYGAMTVAAEEWVVPAVAV